MECPSDEITEKLPPLQTLTFERLSEEDSLVSAGKDFLMNFDDPDYFAAQKDFTDEQKEKDLPAFLTFMSHPKVRNAFNKTVDKKQDRVLFGGDISDHKQWKDIELLFFSTPVLLQKEKVIDYVTQLVRVFMHELQISCEPESLAFFMANDSRLQSVLFRLMYRNMVRNLKLLSNFKFIDTVQVSTKVREAAVGVLADRMYQEGVAEILTSADDALDVEDLVADIAALRSSVKHDAVAQLSANYTGKISFEQLRAENAINNTKESNREKRAIRLMRFLVGIPELSDDVLRDIEGRSLGKAAETLKSLSKEIADTVSMFRDLVPSEPLPEGAEPRLDLLTEVEHMHLSEILNRLEGLLESEYPSDAETREVHEIQLLLLFAKNANWAFVDSAYDEAKQLNRVYGDRINESIRPRSERTLQVFKDSRGNAFLNPEEAEGGVDPVDLHMRKFLFEVEKDVWKPLEVYLPFHASDNKSRTSIEEKTVRQHGDKPHELYDLHRNLVVFNQTQAEMASADGKKLVEAMAAKRMDAYGLVRVDESIPREKIRPGQYKIDFSKMKENENGQSNGLHVVKVYYRTHSTNANEHGVGGEEQYMPLETWVKYKSPDHILHERFYRVNKLIQIVQDYFSDTVFDQFHRYIDYFKRCMKVLKKRSKTQNGMVVESKAV